MRSHALRASSQYAIYSDAVAIYSLRGVLGDSNAIRVRRSSDSAELDFRPSEISDGTLTSWVGAGDGAVVTLYDQSGNGNDAQIGAATIIPRIVSSGTLETVDGKPAIYRPTNAGEPASWVVQIPGFKDLNNISVFSVHSCASAAAADDFYNQALFLYGTVASGKYMGVVDATGLLSGEKITNMLNANRLGSTTYSHSAGEHIIFSAFLGSSGTVLRKNGSAITLNLSSGMTTSTPCGPSATGQTAEVNLQVWVNGVNPGRVMRFQEWIVFPSDKRLAAADYESAINSYYDIF